MDTTAQIGAIVVIILAVSESLKRAGVPSRYIPLISTITGIVAALPFGGVNFLSVASGVILGTATTGAYRVVKTSILNK